MATKNNVTSPTSASLAAANANAVQTAAANAARGIDHECDNNNDVDMINSDGKGGKYYGAGCGGERDRITNHNEYPRQQ